MTVFDFERNRQRQQEIEVTALVALMRYGRTHARKVYAEKKLCEIAFPEDQIDPLQTALNKHPDLYCGPQCPDCKGTEMMNDCEPKWDA